MVFRMQSVVRVEVAVSRKLLIANWTLEWPFPGVQHSMDLQVAVLARLVVAELADVRFLTRMLPHMSFKVTLLASLVVAEVTRERLLLGVLPKMGLEVPEERRAVLAEVAVEGLSLDRGCGGRGRAPLLVCGTLRDSYSKTVRRQLLLVLDERGVNLLLLLWRLVLMLCMLMGHGQLLQVLLGGIQVCIQKLMEISTRDWLGCRRSRLKLHVHPLVKFLHLWYPVESVLRFLMTEVHHCCGATAYGGYCCCRCTGGCCCSGSGGSGRSSGGSGRRGRRRNRRFPREDLHEKTIQLLERGRGNAWSMTGLSSTSRLIRLQLKDIQVNGFIQIIVQ